MRRFIDEYLVDLNATQAAIRAGYSKKTARTMGHENLTKPDIAAAIKVSIDARAVRVGITADRVLEELERLAFSRITDFSLNESGGLVVREGAPVDAVAAVSKARHYHRESTSRHGDSTEYEDEIGLWDKNVALKLAGRHVGLFPDRVEVTGKHGGPIQVEALKAMSTAELKAYAKELAEAADKL